MEPKLKASTRTLIGKRTQKLRRAGILPAVLYGKGKTSESLEVSRKEFDKVFKSAGENTLINLVVEGRERVSPAVKGQGGVLVKNLGEISVEALPTDLPQFIEVSIEGLKEFGNLVRVSELNLSDKVKMLNHPEEVVVTVKAPRTEAELLELEKPAAEAEKAAIEGMAAQAEKDKTEKAEAEGEKPGEEKAAAPEAKAEKKSEKKPEKK
ncbi:MAG: 50S ribosomal protein L25 [Parcubacteria group bacterium GW2011_GWA2_52_8]|nr:MAG: 50S ribosomal protein L25 [Parcubacteria group bacterium GW2011_GWA2_52_8]